MKRRCRACVCLTGLLALLFTVPTSATAQPLPITGTLSQPGYTVIALAGNGQAVSDVADAGAFSLAPPDGTVTLHLRAPDGTYAGPIVLEPSQNFELARAKAAFAQAKAGVASATRKVAAARRKVASATRTVAAAKQSVKRASGKAKQRAQKKLRSAKTRLKRANRQLGRAQARLRRARARLSGAREALQKAEAEDAQRPYRAVEGIRAGAQLGTVLVDPAAGYAKVAGIAEQDWLAWADAARSAQARDGVPIGAGNFGLVRSTRTDGAGVGDSDLDGIPEPLDIDDDGDLILDGYDSPAQARAAQAGGSFPDASRLGIHTQLLVFDFPPLGPVNVNGGSSDAQITEAQTLYGQLAFFWFADDGSAELDCGSLIYCSAGGTGRIPPPQGSIFRSQGLPFPECCDSDGDGLGSLTQAGPARGFGPGSGAMGLWHGATIDQIDSGDVLISRGTSNGVPFESPKTVGFVFSTPPVLAAYDDGQGNAATFAYPRPSPTPDTPVKAGPGGDLLLSLALWRPQRERLADEPGSGRWMDIGHLVYYVDVFVSETEGAYCPLGSLSTTDPELTPTQVTHSPGIEAGAFIDLASDQPPNPVNTVAFTLNLTQCLASKGVTLDAGETARVNFHAVAVGAGGQRSETRSDVPFKRQP